MDIAALATGLAQQRLQEAAGTAVLGLSLGNARQTGADLAKLLDSARLPSFRDPSLGNAVDSLA